MVNQLNYYHYEVEEAQPKASQSGQSVLWAVYMKGYLTSSYYGLWWTKQSEPNPCTDYVKIETTCKCADAIYDRKRATD